MSTSAAILCSALFGILGAFFHLFVTYLRAAALARSKGRFFALVTLPFSLSGPLVAACLSLALLPQAVWATLLGIYAARFVCLRRLARP